MGQAKTHHSGLQPTSQQPASQCGYRSSQTQNSPTGFLRRFQLKHLPKLCFVYTLKLCFEKNRNKLFIALFINYPENNL